MKIRMASAMIAVSLALTPLGASAATYVIEQPLRQTSPSMTVRRNETAPQSVKGWHLDERTAKGGEILAEQGDWLRFASASGNGNSASDTSKYPAIAVYDKSYDFTKPGSFHATVQSPNSADTNRFGFYLGYDGPGDGLFVGFDKNGWFWQKYQDGDGPWFDDTNRIAAPGANQPASVTVAWDGAKATVTVDGVKAFDVDYADMQGLTSTLAMKAGSYKDDTHDEKTDVSIKDFPAETATQFDTETLSTADMTVRVKRNFPSVLDYTMTKLGDKIMYGQPKDVRTVAINGTNLTLKDSDVKFTKNSSTKATYELTLKDEAKKIDAVLTVEITVKANQLHMNVTKVVNNLSDGIPAGNGVEENAIQTIAFPNQSLISVRSDQSDPQFTGAIMSASNTKSGDENLAIERSTSMSERDYMYAFVSGGGLSAGLWSNSEHDGRAATQSYNGGNQNTRVLATTQSVDSATSLGLASAPWYWHRTVSDTNGRKYTLEQTDLPKMAVAIAGDANDDKAVNWEDGAIAYRDIMNNPYKSEEVPELVAWRIAMNFGSQAQNPFLTTLDNVKKVALNTDGLGQSVLLKGYGNEGHDSAHPDYGDINARAGGAADMNTLMEGAAEYGARIGIHVNASEMYPEAKAFSDSLVRRNANGSLYYSWDWIDQAIGINGIYDLASGSRASRFQALKDQVGDNMDFVYLDVWGTKHSGSEDSWETRRIANTINALGWSVGTEYGTAMEYEATFHHWAADLTGGSAQMKGENSQVMRFLRNHQKDSWMGDYPSYGQPSNAPLLGGYSMKDFEGWQGRNDYAAYITNLYTHDVSTKFIQHFKVTQWVNSPLDATSVKDASVNGGNEQITLKDSYGNVVVLKRGSNDVNDAAYRERTITFNGVTVASGKVSRGDNGKDGTESYLLPWLWDASTGKLVESANEKLYHWNTLGGTTEWTLPESWRNLASVKVYELTDQGKTNERTVAVKDGKVSLEAAAQTPYVVTKGAERQLKVTWSTGMHATDVGFNDAKTLGTNWTVAADKSGKAAVVGTSNAVLKLTGGVKVSQKLTDLKAGQRYAVYLGVDNRSGSAARVSVASGGRTLATNSTGRSIAKNYVKAYAHSTTTTIEQGVSGSYFQNMVVWFTAPDSGDVTVVLSHDADTEATGAAYFDDVRVLENKYAGLTLNADGTLKTLTNDFENNAQGIWPFVIGGIEGVEDNRTHLSELHAPYTQGGWDVKKMDDVLDGTWSVKTHGLTQRGALVYQTIPQNVRLEPGETYKVTFKYQAGSDDIYAFVTGDGEGNITSTTNIKKAMGKDADGTFTATVTGSVTGDSWFGIYSTTTAPDLQGTSGNAANLGGYKDFVLDDLKVEHIAPTARTKAEAQTRLDDVRAKYDTMQDQYAPDKWQTYQDTVVRIRVLIDKDGATGDDFTKAYNLAEALDAYMAEVSDKASGDAWDVASDAYTVEAGSVEPTAGGAAEGPANLAQDGNAGTQWHTAYDGTAVANGTAWYQFNLNKPTTIDGLRYLPRAGAANVNGKIVKYKVTLTLADGTSKDVVADGTFDTATKWQRVSFDAVSDVTKVRLTALETTGRLASEANKFAAAAELRVTTPRTYQAQSPDKTKLNELIGTAKGYKAEDYTEASYKKLNTALNAALKASGNTSATAYDVALAEANLVTAINGLKPADPKPDPDPDPDPTPKPDPDPDPTPSPGPDAGNNGGNNGNDNGSKPDQNKPDQNKPDQNKPDQSKPKPNDATDGRIPDTGAPIAAAMATTLLLTAAAATMTALRRRSRR